MPDSALYRAEVTHTRTGTVRHRLRHAVFYLYLDLDEVDEVARASRLFARNRFNVLSFHDRDHGARDGRPAKAWVEDQLRRAGLFDPGGRIRLLTLPRIFGYVFNPLSIYYCFDAGQRLVAVLHEVRNTFGELHGYLLPARPSAQGVVRQEAVKRFYVSPFIGMAGHYRFHLNLPGEDLLVGIRESNADGTGLTAVLRGRRRPLTDRELLRALLAMPLMSIKVIAAIHWHGLRLWLKGARYHQRPPAPRHTVSTGFPDFPQTRRAGGADAKSQVGRSLR